MAEYRLRVVVRTTSGKQEQLRIYSKQRREIKPAKIGNYEDKELNGGDEELWSVSEPGLYVLFHFRVNSNVQAGSPEGDDLDPLRMEIAASYRDHREDLSAILWVIYYCVAGLFLPIMWILSVEVCWFGVMTGTTPQKPL